MTDVFITENFLLQNDRAVELYHRFARDLPIIDYHCHLPPRQIAEDHRFANLTQIWLYGDHYKWRAMRASGRRGTLLHRRRHGLGEVREMGRGRAANAPQPALSLDAPGTQAAAGHQRPPAQPANRAGRSGTIATPRLPRDDMSCRGILRQMRVEVGLHDRRSDRFARIPRRHRGRRGVPDPRAADLPARPGAWRSTIAGDLQSLRRPLGRGQPTATSATPCHASWTPCGKRHDFFHAAGCRLSDHGLATIDAVEGTLRGGDGHLRRGSAAASGRRRSEAARFRSAMLHEMALWDHDRGWTQQFHSARCATTIRGCLPLVGPDTGFDSIGDCVLRPRRWPRFLDRLDRTDQLAKTILYNHQSERERDAGHDDRQLPGRQRARQAAVRQRLVVPRSEGRHGEADSTASRTWAC